MKPLPFSQHPLLSLYKTCQLCPRGCRVDRLSGKTGGCGQDARLRIAAIEAHLGEEPPLSGWNGSGTVFFSGCPLRCSFCQNYQISRLGIGRTWSLQEVARRVIELSTAAGIHNLNLVTPDHFLPHTILLVEELMDRGIKLPVVYNVSGYQRVESLRIAEPYVHIYLPDFKYGDRALAAMLSKAEEYTSVALGAIEEMLRQKGFLDSWGNVTQESGEEQPLSLASKGVMVRHMVLPGYLRNSLEALTMLFVEFGPDLPLSLMSQYVPMGNQPAESLQRTVSSLEFQQVLDHAMELGFRRILYQPPNSHSSDPSQRPFLPDFTRRRPFSGNLKARRRKGTQIQRPSPPS